MTKQKTYRVGIVGSGFGVKVHLPAFAAHSRFEVVALASPNRAVDIARERGIPHAFISCADMLAGCELDAVSIAAPPFTHYDDVLAASAARKHILCEKPFALTVAQAEAMRDAGKAAGTACGVAHEFRWIPERVAIKELIVNGHLDPLREIEITQLAGWLRASGDRPRGWWFERQRGGGLAGALLSHIIDSATWLAGRPPVSSTGFIRTANPRRTDSDGSFESTVDDGAFALVDYGQGVVGRLTCDATSAVESFTLSAHGENRTAVASGAGMTELRLFSVDADETSELQCKPSQYAKFESINGNLPLFMHLLDAFVEHIETGRSDLPTFEEAVHTQRVLASIGYGS